MLNIRINVPHLTLVVNKEKAVKKMKKRKKKKLDGHAMSDDIL